VSPMIQLDSAHRLGSRRMRSVKSWHCGLHERPEAGLYRLGTIRQPTSPSCRPVLQSEAKEMGSIQMMRRRPAIHPAANVRGLLLLVCRRDQQRCQAVCGWAVNDGWQTNGGCTKTQGELEDPYAGTRTGVISSEVGSLSTAMRVSVRTVISSSWPKAEAERRA